MYQPMVLVLDSVLNIVTEMPGMDAAACILNFSTRYSQVAYLQSNVPAGQAATIQEGPTGTFHLLSRVPQY